MNTYYYIYPTKNRSCSLGQVSGRVLAQDSVINFKFALAMCDRGHMSERMVNT